MFRKKNNSTSLDLLVQFVEFKISFEEFWYHYVSNEELCKLFLKFDHKLFYYRGFYSNFDKLRLINVDRIIMKKQIYKMFTQLLDLYGKKYNDNYFDSDFYLIDNMQQDWVNIHNDELISKLLMKVSSSMSVDEKNKAIYEEICKMFKFKKMKPKWLQSPEWPVVNGEPLVFVEQDYDPDDILVNQVTYIFLDVNSNKYHRVIQHD
jgi:hypothetical protein